MNKTPIKTESDGKGKNVFLFREEDDRLIIQGTHVIYSIEQTGREIYESIDGKRSVKDIIKLLSDKYNISEKEASEDVLAFLNELLECNLIVLK